MNEPTMQEKATSNVGGKDWKLAFQKKNSEENQTENELKPEFLIFKYTFSLVPRS